MIQIEALRKTPAELMLQAGAKVYRLRRVDRLKPAIEA